jgi:hypothetical protein
MVKNNLPLPTPSAKVIPFRRKVTPREYSDQEIREYLRSIWSDPEQPLVKRAEAAILSPWFGEEWPRKERA